MASELILKVVTPFGEFFNETITSCTIPGTRGQFQILKDHAALISTVNVGSLKIEYSDAKSVFVAVSGGFCEVKDNQVEIIVESAEFPGNIDVARAESSKKRAEERLSSNNTDVDTDRAKIALMRALNRLKVSELR